MPPALREAKPLSGATVAKKRGPVPRPDDERTATITFRCRPVYRDWLASFAENQRDIPSRLIDMGLVCLAKQLGYKPPPKR